MSNYNDISSFSITNDFHLEIEYDSSFKFLYKNITDLSINRDINDLDCFVIVDKFEKLLEVDDFLLINKLFSINYDQDFFKNNMVWKMNLLQIEWSLTIYVIYENKVDLV